jgi:transcription antitermination factor NusG
MRGDALYWICVSVNPVVFQSQDKNQLTNIFSRIFGDDYLEHYLLDHNEFEKNNELDKYVFVHCLEYEKYAKALQSSRYIKNVFNSFDDISPIPEEEILGTKNTVGNIIQDEQYYVNRTGFFMFGDIVRILQGPLSAMNGIIIEKCSEEDHYLVLFRLFVSHFFEKIKISNMAFHSSIFKYIKVPVKYKFARKSDKKIKEIVKKYNNAIKTYSEKKLVTKISPRKKGI